MPARLPSRSCAREHPPMAIAGRGPGPHASGDAEHARTGGPDLGDGPVAFRYGAVFLIVLALEAGALTIAIATSRVRPAVRRRRAVVGVVVGGAVAVGVLTGIVSPAAV